MNIHSDKKKSNHQSVSANGGGAVNSKPTFQFEDNRPQSIVQRVQIEGLSNKAINTAGVYQRVVLTNSLKRKIETWAGDKSGNVIQWFEDANLLTAADVNAALKLTFSRWWDVKEYEDPVGMTSDVFNGVAAAAGSAAAAPAAPVDPLAAVRTKLNAAGLSPGDFSAGELQSILDLKNGGQSWDSSIQAINTARLARIEAARLQAERVARYSGAKAAGDLIFTGGLLQSIWNLSYSVAAGTAGANTTLGGTYTDAVIIAAATAWNGHATIAPAAAAGADAASVTNFHVPGAPAFIEDKSTRAHNQDPTRGRQADFISRWGALSINVHVNSSTAH